MRIESQTNDDRMRLGELIEHIPVAMMTTRHEEDALISRPMSPLQMDEEGAIWLFTDTRTEKAVHLRAVNLAFSDADRAVYVSLSGSGEIHTDRQQIDRLWTLSANLWFPEGQDSHNLALLRIVPDVAEYWDANHSSMVRLLAVAASVVAGTPIGMGEHDSLTELKST
jgi:general stress protein 26